MADNDQAQADLSDSTPGDDLALQGASHDPAIAGATNLADYQALLENLPDDEQGDEPAEFEDLAADEEDAGNGEEEESPAEEVEESEEAAEEEPEPKSSNRFRFNSPEDQAVAALAKATGKSLIEAGLMIKAATATAAEAAVVEEAAPVRTSADVDSELESVEQEFADAMEAMEFEKIAAINKKQRKLIEEKAELRYSEVQATATKETAEEAQFFSDYEKAEAKAVAHYPDTTDPESALTKRMVELDQTMKRLGDPLFHSPNKPFLLAQKAAIELGIPMADPKAAKSAPASPATKRRPVPPASGNARTTAPVDSATKLEKAISNVATLEDYDKLAASVGVGGL